ncbi:hypothetical protein [Streptomyces sp. NBC_00557]|uniref:hypothetical protein n=1 Tax=Streptomyces sp. NBC_00557 TaxID=2975776 RepID=UPI003FCEC29E
MVHVRRSGRVRRERVLGALDSAGTALPRAAREAEAQVRRSTYGRLPADTHPPIAATAPLLVAAMRSSSYPAALDLLLTAARTRLDHIRAGGAG